MHDSVFFVRLLSVTIKLITNHDGPMLLVSISLRLQEALTFECLRFGGIVFAKTLYWLGLLLCFQFLWLIMLRYATLIFVFHLLQESFVCCLIELVKVISFELKLDTARLLSWRCTWFVILILRLHKTTAQILSLVTDAHSNSESLVRIDWREVALKFYLHVVRVRITNCYRLF